MTKHRLIVIMGPSGCGKSTIARALSSRVDWPWLEGDDYHLPHNKAKMASGCPLDDQDRAGWVDAMIEAIRAKPLQNQILACSALTPYVQQRLEQESGYAVMFVILKLPCNVLRMRLAQRRGHFMPPGLLDSQIEALQIPDNAWQIDGNRSVEETVQDIAVMIDSNS